MNNNKFYNKIIKFVFEDIVSKFFYKNIGDLVKTNLMNGMFSYFLYKFFFPVYNSFKFFNLPSLIYFCVGNIFVKYS